MPIRARAASIVRSLAALVLCVEDANASASNASIAAARSSSERTCGSPTNSRASLPGASDLRPGSATRAGDRERDDDGGGTDKDEHTPGGLDLLVPAADLAVAFAFEQITTGTPAAQPDVGEGARDERDKERNARQVSCKPNGD